MPFNKTILSSVEYLEYLKNNPQATVESFLSSMSPTEKATFLQKMEKQTIVDEQAKEDKKKSDNKLGNVAGQRIRAKTSDQNEVILDKIIEAALQDIGKTPEDLDKLTSSERVALANSINQAKETYIQLLPPATIVKTAEELALALNNPQLSADEKSLKESQLRKLSEYMLGLVGSYASGQSIVDQLNIADVHDGFGKLLDYVEKHGSDQAAIKKNVDICRQKLAEQIKIYDQDNGIIDLEKADNNSKKNLEQRLEKVTSVAAEYKPSGDIAKILGAIEFADKDGKIISQVDDKGNILPNSELAALMAMVQSELIKNGTFSKEEITPAWIAANGDRFLGEKITALINAELLSRGEDPNKTATVLSAISSGQKFTVASNTVAAATAAHVNTHMGFINRVAGKVGKSSKLVSGLYAPIAKIDTLAQKRWGQEYARTKGFLQVIGCNMARAGALSLFCNSAARIVPYGSMVAAGVGFAVSVGQFASLYSRQKKHFESKGEKYNLLSFVNQNKVALGMVAASVACTALGVPEGAMALRYVNMGRSGLSTFVQARKNGDKLWTQIWKTAVAGGSTYATTLACEEVAERYIDPHMVQTEIIPGKETPGLFLPGETETIQSTEWDMDIVKHAHDVLRGVGNYQATGERWTEVEMDNGLNSLGVNPEEYHNLETKIANGESLSGNERLVYNQGNDAIVSLYRINHADELMPVSMRNDGFDTRDAVAALRHGQDLTESQQSAIDRAQEVIRARTGHAVEAPYINNGGVEADRIASLDEARSGLKSYRPGDDLGEDYKTVGIDIKYNDISFPGETIPEQVITTPLPTVVPYLPADNLWMARHRYLLERAGSLADYLKKTFAPQSPEDNNPPSQPISGIKDEKPPVDKPTTKSQPTKPDNQGEDNATKKKYTISKHNLIEKMGVYKRRAQDAISGVKGKKVEKKQEQQQAVVSATKER